MAERLSIGTQKFNETDSTNIDEIIRQTSDNGNDVWYVDSAATGTGDGTSWTDACTLPSQAIALAALGDLIVIMPGTYNENSAAGGLVITKSGLRIIALQNDGRQNTIITNTLAGATSVITVSGSGNVIKGLYASQAGINAGWTISGQSNAFYACNSVSCTNGLIITGPNNSFYNIFSSNYTGSAYLLNATYGNVFFGCYAANGTGGADIGFNLTGLGYFNVFKDCYGLSGWTGINLVATMSPNMFINSTMAGYTILKTDLGAANKFVNLGEESKILAGNSLQDDLASISTDEEAILRYTSAKGVNMWYVDASVGASGTGTSWASPFKTIQEAETARASGDNILIRAGTYNENANAGGLTITKNNGAFLALGESYEAVKINNTNVGATSSVTISGSNNVFQGITTYQALVYGWNVTGNDNVFTRCGTNAATRGFYINGTATSNSLNDCRSSQSTDASFYIAATATFILGAAVAISDIGFRFANGAMINVLRSCVAADCTTAGFQFDAGSLLDYAINCSGKNGTNIIDNSVGQSRILGFTEESQIVVGNSIQDDLNSIYRNTASISLCYPTLSAGITVTSGTAAWALAGSSTIVGTNTISSQFHVTGISIDSITTTTTIQYELQLAYGATPTIFAKIPFDGSHSGISYVNLGVLSPEIPANSPITAQLASSDTNAQTVNLKLIYHTHS